MKAVDVLKETGRADEKSMFTAKISKERNEMVAAFRRESGKDNGQILEEALDDYFEGYVPSTEAVDVETLMIL